MYHGDIRLGDTIDIKFTTVSTAGVPTTLAGSPVISAYVGNGTTEITAGITLSVDFDSRTGMHNVRVVASSGNGYATATNVQLVITTGTVGGASVVGYVVGTFSIEARSAVMPTTAARTLDVSAGGEAGLDWANIGSPTTAQNLSATNIDVDQIVASVSGAVGSVTGNVGGNVTGSVGSVVATVAANLTQILGTALTETAGQIAAAFKQFFDVATPTGTMKAITNVVTATNLTNAPTAGDFTAVMKTSLNAATPASVQNISAQTGDSFARLGAPAGASVSADIAAIEAQTDDIGAAGAGLTALGDARIANLDAAITTRATPAQVNTEVDTALADVNLDHLVGTAASIPAIVAGTYIDQMMDDGTAVYDRTTDSLQAIADSGGGGPTVSQIVDGVWDEAIAGHLTGGTTGAALNGAGSAGDPWTTPLPGAYGAGTAGNIVGNNLDAAVSTLASAAALATVQADTDDIQAKLGTPAGASLAADIAAIEAQTDDIGVAGAGLTALGDARLANLDATVSSRLATAGYTAPPSAAVIAGAVLDEDMTAHQTQGSLGQAIGDPVADTNTIYKAVVTDAAGATVGVDVVAVKAETASIQTDTNDLQARTPAALVSGRMDASVGAMATDVLTNTALAASAVTEIQTGLATPTNITAGIVTTVSGNVNGSVGSVTGLTPATIVAAWLAAVVEGAHTLGDYMRLFAGVLTGKSSGGGTATVVFRDVADTKNRISSTVDVSGNRTAVGTRDGT